ncbi:hypothetical protein HanRHA438_Chr01g0010131 [Helianthus annuus]|nr:hypothetical protein HanHA300_Chr01g0008021 [Helianthus annuus]KAJ0626053.1 hypothetical protein HanHA89_Chr01g0008681 [Helianthus annuus]KAJ0823804.1 hypothetical protein HanLR1_Chr00c0189g0726991 [Helianthus annuus]KAJ0946985.1 hypothetical protein HanRHA438_Chr01g0010131 [Helianthus annuus]
MHLNKESDMMGYTGSRNAGGSPEFKYTGIFLFVVIMILLLGQDRPRPLPVIKELKDASDVIERKGSPSWDYDVWEVAKISCKSDYTSGSTGSRDSTRCNSYL